MNIRKATPFDTLTLSSLASDVQSLHAQHHPTVFKLPDADGFAQSFFAEMLTDPAVSIFIAEEGEQALGYVLCKLIERPENPFTYPVRYLLIDQISVRPAARRQGVGAALFQRAEKLARELEVRRIQLDSWDFNLNAHEFFERQGFRKFNFRFWKHL